MMMFFGACASSRADVPAQPAVTITAANAVDNHRYHWRTIRCRMSVLVYFVSTASGNHVTIPGKIVISAMQIIIRQKNGIDAYAT